MTGVVSEVELPLVDAEERFVGRLRISVLQSMPTVLGQPVLLDLREAPDDDGLEGVRLIEGGEYRYAVEHAAAERFAWQPSELFDPDDSRQRQGRLRPRQGTGRIDIVATMDGVASKPISVEVRSVKLGYLDDYRHMLNGIARFGSELVLERFAMSSQRVLVDDKNDSATLYQRFVFLSSLLRGDSLASGLRRVLASPYVQWKQVQEVVPQGRGLQGGGTIGRRLCAAGERIAWAESPLSEVDTLPLRLADARTHESVDNVPNRFVKLALQQWRAVTAEMQRRLEVEAAGARLAGTKTPAPVQRGLAEAESLAEYLDELLRHPLFTEIGLLGEFPASNQVLQKRDGYRDVLETYVLYEFGSKLTWKGGEDVFAAGQRDVATLYEYWVFLELARIVSDACSVKPDLAALVDEKGDSLGLVLKRGQEQRIGGAITRRGRTYKLDLFFNREFRPETESWTRTMRPDCSLRIAATDGVAPPAQDLWLHFDAKYRVQAVRITDEDHQKEDVTFDVKNDDLLKMHAYRDAIVRAAGAYVIYPGEKSPFKPRHQERLPSLGAFPLRPGEHGHAEGAGAIRAFLDAVIEQLCDQGSRFERARHWDDLIYGEPVTPTSTDAVPFLEEPAADTLVLLGYLRSPEHAAWVEERCLYNLRADSSRRGAVAATGRELASRYLLAYDELGARGIYRIVGAPRVLMREGLEALNYPGPRGEAYFVVQLEHVDQPNWLRRLDLPQLREEAGVSQGAPFVITWLQLTLAARSS